MGDPWVGLTAAAVDGAGRCNSGDPWDEHALQISSGSSPTGRQRDHTDEVCISKRATTSWKAIE